MDIEHIDFCPSKGATPCTANYAHHNEPKDHHWWSGWPGAYCIKCGVEDLYEICIGIVCYCPCHDDFWKSYEDAITEDITKDHEFDIPFE